MKMKNIVILTGGLLIACFITTSSRAQDKKLDNLAISNIKAGYYADKAVDSLSIQLDSMEIQHAKSRMSISALMDLTNELDQNNKDVKFNNRSLKRRLEISVENERKAKKKSRVYQSVIGVFVLIFGLSLK